MDDKKRQAIAQRLQALSIQNEGSLTPDAVIEDARNPSSPLHSEFEWDVKKAAMNAWRETARRLIRSVTIEVTTETKVVMIPRYIRNPDAKSSEQSYSDVQTLRTEKDRAFSAFMYEIDRVENSIDRAKKIAVGLGLEGDVVFIHQKVVEVRKKAENKKDNYQIRNRTSAARV